MKKSLLNSQKRETAILCNQAEEHEFCEHCGMLLCFGQLCGAVSSEPDCHTCNDSGFMPALQSGIIHVDMGKVPCEECEAWRDSLAS